MNNKESFQERALLTWFFWGSFFQYYLIPIFFQKILKTMKRDIHEFSSSECANFRDELMTETTALCLNVLEKSTISKYYSEYLDRLIQGFFSDLAFGGNKTGGKRYNEAKIKYIKINFDDKVKIFADSINNISVPLKNKTLIGSDTVYMFWGFVGIHCAEDIVKWSVRLSSEEAFKIQNEISKIFEIDNSRRDSEMNYDKQIRELLEFYGFGFKYLDKNAEELYKNLRKLGKDI